MRTLLILGLLATGIVLGGCQGSSDPGIPAEATASMDKVGEGARASGGDWEKLTADQKKAFLDRTGNDETAARAMLKQISEAASKRPKAPAQ